MEERPVNKRQIFVKRLVVPGEHGTWAWLLIPFLAGALVAPALGAAAAGATPALLLTLAGGLAAFLLRQPATAWTRIRRGRGQAGLEKLALAWALALAALALLCLAGLLLLGRTALAGVGGIAAGLAALYLYAARLGRSGLRALWMELAGAAGLALMAPAAVVAVLGHLPASALLLWGVTALQNGLSVLYVRLRLADSHRRAASRWPVFLAHLLGLSLLLLGGLWGQLPLLLSLFFVAYLLRALWLARRPRPILNVRRFGFTELGISLAGGLWIAFSYLVWWP